MAEKWGLFSPLPYFFWCRDFLSASTSFFAWRAAFFAIFTTDFACLRLALAAFTRARLSSVGVCTPASVEFDGFWGCSFMGMLGCHLPLRLNVGMTGILCDEVVTLARGISQQLNCYNSRPRPGASIVACKWRYRHLVGVECRLAGARISPSSLARRSHIAAASKLRFGPGLGRERRLRLQA